MNFILGPDKTLQVSPQTDDLIPVSYLAYRDNSDNNLLPESMFNKAPFVFTGYDRENISHKDDYQLGYMPYSKKTGTLLLWTILTTPPIGRR